MNEQREIIYGERRKVLGTGESMRDSIYHMISEYVENLVDMEISADQDPEDWDLTELNVAPEEYDPHDRGRDAGRHEEAGSEEAEAPPERVGGEIATR